MLVNMVAEPGNNGAVESLELTPSRCMVRYRENVLNTQDFADVFKKL